MVPSDWKTRIDGSRWRVVEAPHVCPEDGHCAHLECPNATPGYRLVRAVWRNQAIVGMEVFVRAQSVASAVDALGRTTGVVSREWVKEARNG